MRDFSEYPPDISKDYSINYLKFDLDFLLSWVTSSDGLEKAYEVVRISTVYGMELAVYLLFSSDLRFSNEI